MKKIELNISTLVIVTSFLVLASFASNLHAQDRGSVWVHGLNSKGSDWSKWEQLFTQERRLFDRTYAGQPYTYDTKVGVAETALNVRFSYTPDNRTIYLGHSMGGVVGREVDVNYPNSFGGIVTFGSPLDGAKISNSVASGEADGFIANGVNKIAQGPVRQLGIVTYIIWGLVADDVIKSIKDKAIKINITTDKGAQDLQEWSTYMNSGIRNAITSTPKIHVYGNEQSPVLWRFATSAQNFTSGSAAFNDTYYVDFANTAGDVYEAAMWINYGLAAAVGWWTFGIGAIYYIWVADGWADGKNWWRYDSESGWNSLIGSNSYAYRAINYSTFDYIEFNQCMYGGGGYNYGSYTYNRYNDCVTLATSYYTYYYYSPVNGQSDGFIKAPSQTGYNSNWSNNAVSIEALGVNHIEMLDNDKIQVIMNGIFDGTSNPVSDPFFRTPRR